MRGLVRRSISFKVGDFVNSETLREIRRLYCAIEKEKSLKERKPSVQVKNK